MLGQIGIRANLISQSKSLHFPVIQKAEADFYLLGWGVPPYDSEYIFNYLYHTRTDKFGGTDFEDVEAARRDAPQAFRTQERAVTAADYAAAAERRADVQRAAATFRWTGSWHTVFVTADRVGGAALIASRTRPFT